MKLFKVLMSAAFIVFVIYIAGLIFTINEDLKSNNSVSRETALSEEELNLSEEELNQKIYDSLIEKDLDEYAEHFDKSLEPEEISEPTEPTNIITVDVGTLLNLVESDIESAKQRYEGQWLQLSGKVVSVKSYDYHTWTVQYPWAEAPIKHSNNESFYTINGVKVQSPLIYWLAVEQRFVQPDVIVEMDIFLCPHPEKEGCYLSYPQHSFVTIVAYCASVSENNVVLIDGRYPE